MSHTVWTQWRNLDGPPGFEMVHSEPPDDVEAIGEEVTVYVPRYPGEAALEVIPSLSALEVSQPYAWGYEDAFEVLPPAVTLCNARGLHDVSTVELALGLIIASQRDLATFVENQQASRWDQDVKRSTADTRFGIVGYGSIGTRLH